MTVPPRFSLRAVICSHGWSVLPPFSIDDDDQGLSVALHDDHVPPCIVSFRQQDNTLRITVDRAPKNDIALFRRRLREVVRSVLRLDEDLAGFYASLRPHRHLRWIPRLGAGRILRAATAFEDTVKIICTTNCSWDLTELMVKRLTETIGMRVNGRYTFPTAERMAEQPESFYRNTIRAGYRSPYLAELAQRVARGELDLESLRGRKVPKEELRKILVSIKGIGPYAIDNLLRFHGAYDSFAHDSWIRAQYYRIYHNGRTVTDRTIERRYAPFGEWKGLVYWLDMTRPWYGKNFAFLS